MVLIGGGSKAKLEVIECRSRSRIYVNYQSTIVELGGESQELATIDLIHPAR
jgi:hypothetical protein